MQKTLHTSLVKNIYVMNFNDFSNYLTNSTFILNRKMSSLHSDFIVKFYSRDYLHKNNKLSDKVKVFDSSFVQICGN